jgi:dimethylhistidine N-methyltransferase
MNEATVMRPMTDYRPARPDIWAEVAFGLSHVQKTIPCKFLYDERGSRLFNEICELDEYYPTRTEDQILRDNIVEITRMMGDGCRLVEFGSGSSVKTRHLLRHLSGVSSYIPIDISRSQLFESVAQLTDEFPYLEICPVEGDYYGISRLPDSGGKPRRTVAFFPGSTIGNFEPGEAVAFLSHIASLCGDDGGLLIGFDLKKDKRILEPAYNDSKGVTARFNLNVLARANRELGTDFNLEAFRHHAPYNEKLGRIEMHLVSTRRQIVHLDSLQFAFDKGEYITTEYSYKYTVPGFTELALRAGFELVKSWEDTNHLFGVLLLRRKRTEFGSAEPLMDLSDDFDIAERCNDVENATV